MVSVDLPAEIEKRLDALASETGRSREFYIREAILEHLDDVEDVYLAEQQLAEIRAGRAKTIPLEELMKQHGMEDQLRPKGPAPSGAARSTGQQEDISVSV